MKKVKKILKITGIIIGTLIIIAAGLYLFVDYRIHEQANRTFHFPDETLAVANTGEAISQGRHLAEIKGCTDCHGSDMGGKIFLNDKALGIVSASNLTGGRGGLGGYTVADWMRALRHGVNRQGKPLLIMPSHESTMMSKTDLAALIAYCRQLPSVDRTLPQNNLGPLGKVLGFFGKIPLYPVDNINHTVAAVETAY